MPTTNLPTDPALAERINLSIDAWKRKLLDLSKRNRALNFKATRSSTVGIVDEKPAEVFRQLYLLEQAMTFAAASRPEPPPAAGTGAGSIGSTAPAVAGLGDQAAAAEDEFASVPFAPYQRTALDSRHTDDVLQTASDPDQRTARFAGWRS